MTPADIAWTVGAIYLWGVATTMAIIVLIMLGAQSAGYRWTLPPRLLALGAVVASLFWPFTIGRVLSIAFTKD